jgi:hypothetical protein
MASSEHPKHRAKPSGKKAEKLSKREQSERFIETAREIEADESGRVFERAIDFVLVPKEKKRG